MFDSSNVTLGLGPAIHGAVADRAVDVSVRFGLEGIAGSVPPRQGVHGALRVDLHLLLQLLDPLQLGNFLVVLPPRQVRLQRLLAGHGEVTHLAPGGLHLRRRELGGNQERLLLRWCTVVNYLGGHEVTSS